MLYANGMSGLSLLVIKLCVASAKNSVAIRRSSVAPSTNSSCSQSLSTRTDSNRLGGAICEPRPMTRDDLLGCEESMGKPSGQSLNYDAIMPPNEYCTDVSVQRQML